MNNVQGAKSLQPAQLIERLLEWVSSERGEDFYSHYAELVCALCQGQAALVVTHEDPVAMLGAFGQPHELALLQTQIDAPLLEVLTHSGYTHRNLRQENGLGAILVAIALRADRPCTLLMLLPERQRSYLKEVLVRALLVKDLTRSNPHPGDSTPGAALAVTAQDGQLAHSAADGALLQVLALGADVMQNQRFAAANLTLVNGVLSVMGLRQAALCWRLESQARLLAVSHLERFERTSPLVQQIEVAAMEVLAVDQVIAVDRQATDSSNQPPEHLRLCEVMGTDVRGVIGLPIRDGNGQTQAVLLGVVDRDWPSQEVLNNVLLMLEMIYPRLADMRQQDAWVGQRLRYQMGGWLETLLGPTRPWVKFGAVLVSILVLLLVFGRWPYRVEASAQLATDYTRVLGSQMDGRVEDVFVNVGDMVQADQLMARMDTSDLMQQSVEVRAEIQRYRAEEDKARAANALADVQVSRYRREQAEAKLARVTYLLAQAEVRAPFDGVVVEGERRDLQGASLRRGEQMFRVAQVRDLYVVAQVSEKDVREVEPDAHAVAILLSQTSVEIPLKVVNFVPMAQVKGEQGNQFLLKAEIEGDVAAWWRPGMSGLVKVEAGSRNIGWILFHSVWDTLRLKFWW